MGIFHLVAPSWSIPWCDGVACLYDLDTVSVGAMAADGNDLAGLVDGYRLY